MNYYIAVSLNDNFAEWYVTSAKSEKGAKIAASKLKVRMQRDFPRSQTRALVGYGDGYNIGCLATSGTSGKWVQPN